MYEYILNSKILTGGELLDVIQHADVTSRLLRWYNGRCWGENSEA